MKRTTILAWIAVLGCVLPAAASAADWKVNAERAKKLLGDSDVDKRTKCMGDVALRDGTDDRVANDFWNIQQTAGGLPEHLSFEKFVELVSLKYREYLGKDMWTDLSDEEFVDGLRPLDGNTLKVFDFLNGTVHQAGAGNAHRCLWNYILFGTHDSDSMYSCYSEVFVDDDASEKEWFEKHCT